jgi:hypothetical protein
MNALLDRIERDLERLSEIVSFSPICSEILDRVRREHGPSVVVPS